MKKVLAMTLAIVLILSMSAIAFADTTPNNQFADVPAEILQDFIDVTPEGQYLVDVNYVPIDEKSYMYEGIYRSLVQPRGSRVTDSKYSQIFHENIDTAAITYWLWGEFDYDGVTSECKRFQYDCTYEYNGPLYSFEVVAQSPRIAGNSAYVAVTYNAYSSNGTQVCHATPTIACDAYGNVY